MTWLPFYALPNYLGGKRRLAPTIFAEISKVYPARTWPALTLLDPCAGACAISLFGKAQGFRVIAGDIAERSHIIQQAVVSNNGELLTDQDLGFLLQERNGYDRFVSEHFVPAHFPTKFAEFLDRAMANIAEHPSAIKRALLKVILYKMMLGPIIHYGITSISRNTEAGRLEHIPAHTIRRVQNWWLTTPAVPVKRLARMINRAVFGNGHENLAHQVDAADLVEQYAAQTDILYLDPPYPEVRGYEESYGVLDSVFAGEVIRLRRSLWSTPQFTLQLLNLLDVAEEIPLWVISYGSVGTSLSQVLALVEEYRPAFTLTVAFPHLHAIARQEVSEENKEHLIIAQRT